MSDDTLDKTTVLETLNRLHRYYGDCARTVVKMTKESAHCQSMVEYAVVASRWEAKQDAVAMVADDLGVELDQVKKEQEA